MEGAAHCNGQTRSACPAVIRTEATPTHLVKLNGLCFQFLFVRLFIAQWLNHTIISVHLLGQNRKRQGQIVNKGDYTVLIVSRKRAQ